MEYVYRLCCLQLKTFSFKSADKVQTDKQTTAGVGNNGTHRLHEVKTGAWSGIQVSRAYTRSHFFLTFCSL